MGDAANAAMTNSFLEVSAELKRVTTALDRTTLQLTRIANASEDTNALALNEVRDAKLAMERVAAATEKQAAKLERIETVLGIVEREATSKQKTHEKDEHAAVGIIKAFGALPPSARWALVLLAPSLVVIGMAVHELFLK